MFRDKSKERKNNTTQKLLTWLASDGGFVCEDGWLLYRDQCYLFTTYARNWYAARRECQDLGLDADLAQIRVPEVDAFLLSKEITSFIVFPFVFCSFNPFHEAMNRLVSAMTFNVSNTGIKLHDPSKRQYARCDPYP